MRNPDDDKRRARATEHAQLAITRALEAAGIPVPKLLPAMLASTPTVREERDPLQGRRARLDELRWPARALDFAERPDDTEAMRVVRAWDRQGLVFVLSGGKGTGKTVAAAWRALNDPSPAAFRFVRAATLVRTSRFSDECAELLDAPALCIDDLGAEYNDAKGSFLADFEEIVDTFYSDRRRLIITTNLPGKEFKLRYGARVVDRITECAEWRHIEGRSMRARERGENEERAPWEDE